MLVIGELTAGAGGRPIARLPSLDVAGGQAALLTGPSGSGKTTLLLAIAGLADVVGGAIRVGETDVTGLDPRGRDRHRGRYIGVIFQEPHLLAGLSALDNMLVAPFAAGMRSDRARAIALLDRLGVGDRRDARAETLSRGEAQRVAIARAMLLDPLLILADEPTASLDDASCDAVIDLLTEATRDTGAALVVATHDNRVRQRIGRAVAAEPIR